MPSRRLGRSLGVDPIPFKTCNWNCVYCQLGHTAPLTGEREEFFPADEIVAEVKEALAAHAGAVDWITFVGSGEPTLHAGLGRMLRAVKALTDLPVAVITNGSLLDRPEVREELRPADAVMPTLDAGTERLYLRLNRPQPGFSFAKLVDGLAAFGEEYDGRYWVEVMLVKGMNDTEEALRDLAAVLRRVRATEIHVNLPVRPPAEPWVQPPDAERLRRATEVLGEVAHVVAPTAASIDLSGYDDLVEAVLHILQCHPLRDEELRAALARHAPAVVDDTIDALVESGRAQLVTRDGGLYWCYGDSRYGRHHVT